MCTNVGNTRAEKVSFYLSHKNEILVLRDVVEISTLQFYIASLNLSRDFPLVVNQNF